MIEFLKLGPRFFAILSAFIPVMTWHRMVSPRETRGSTYFGVHVQPAFSESEAGREIMQQFRNRLWIISFGGALVAAMVPERFAIVAGILLPSLFAWIAFAAASRRTRFEAEADGQLADAPSVRVASLSTNDDRDMRWLNLLDWAAMVIPPLFPLFTAAVLVLHWNGLPDHMKGVSSTLPLVLSVGLGLLASFNQWALIFRARSSDWAPTSFASHRYRTWLGVMHATIFTFVTGSMCFNLLVGANRSLGWVSDPPLFGYFGILFPVEALWIIAVWRMRGWLRSHTARESFDPMPDNCWKLGFFYVNRADPALVVPLRGGVGCSYNCGRPAVLAVLTSVTVLTLLGLIQGVTGLS